MCGFVDMKDSGVAIACFVNAIPALLNGILVRPLQDDRIARAETEARDMAVIS